MGVAVIDLEPAAIARVAYEARRVYARALGQQVLPDWDQAPPELRRQALLGVEAVLRGAAGTGARLHDILRRAHPLGSPSPLFKTEYHDLPLAERRKILLFRAIVLALVDGPCTGLCHDEKCETIEDHACHLETCLSRFGIQPGAWAPAPAASLAAPPLKLYS